MRLTDGRFYQQAFTGLHRGSGYKETLSIAKGFITTAAEGIVRPLGGRVCLPGLTDAHLHIFPLALFRLQLDIATAGVRSVDTLLDALEQIPPERRFGGWRQGAVLIEDTFKEQRLPTLAELDTRFPDSPVLLRRYCGHVAVMNTAAMKELGLHHTVPKVNSGTFARDTNGALTGQANEGAAGWVFAQAPAPPDDMILSEIRTVLRDCVSFGLTSLVEAAVGFTLGYDKEAAIWAKLRAQNNIPVRLGFMNELTAHDAAGRGLVPEWGRDWSNETLKFFADGIIGGRTGALSRPYDDTGERGDLMHPKGVLEHQFAQAHADGWRIAVHATGDHGIDRVLSGLAKAQGDDTERRHRIEHFFVPPQNGLARAAQARIAVVMQPGFLQRMGANIARGLGDRVQGVVYPGASVLAAGASLVFSSDAPTGPLSPWINLCHAVNRLGTTGEIIGPGEATKRTEALDAYIGGGCWAMRHESFRGTLAPGMVADIVVLNMDPLTVPLDELQDCRCVFALKEGQVVRDQL